MSSVLLVSESATLLSHAPRDGAQLFCVFHNIDPERPTLKKELCSFWPRTCKGKKNIPQLRDEDPTVMGSGREGQDRNGI